MYVYTYIHMYTVLAGEGVAQLPPRAWAKRTCTIMVATITVQYNMI